MCSLYALIAKKVFIIRLAIAETCQQFVCASSAAANCRLPLLEMTSGYFNKAVVLV
jgi:hypothetical protein